MNHRRCSAFHLLTNYSDNIVAEAETYLQIVKNFISISFGHPDIFNK